jgi:hypothetical protein
LFEDDGVLKPREFDVFWGMEDFYRLYADLPLPDLVKVARTPSDYLPEAVSAAERILRERGVTREQIAAEEWVIAQKEMADGLKRNSRRDYLGWLEELFGREQLMSPSERWYAGLLLVYGIYYTYSIYVTIRHLIWMARSPYLVVTGSYIAWNWGFAIYLTISLYFVLKQRWLGWSMLMIHVAVFTCIKGAFLFRLEARHEFFFPVHYLWIVEMILYGGVAVLLWKPDVTATFKLTERIKGRTALASVVAGLVTLLLY